MVDLSAGSGPGSCGGGGVSGRHTANRLMWACVSHHCMEGGTCTHMLYFDNQYHLKLHFKY